MSTGYKFYVDYLLFVIPILWFSLHMYRKFTDVKKLLFWHKIRYRKEAFVPSTRKSNYLGRLLFEQCIRPTASSALGSFLDTQKLSGPAPDLKTHNMHFNRIRKWFNFEKHWCLANSFSDHVSLRMKKKKKRNLPTLFHKLMIRMK